MLRALVRNEICWFRFSATRDLMLIQQNKFYRISNRSRVTELVCTVTGTKNCKKEWWIMTHRDAVILQKIFVTRRRITFYSLLNTSCCSEYVYIESWMMTIKCIQLTIALIWMNSFSDSVRIHSAAKTYRRVNRRRYFNVADWAVTIVGSIYGDTLENTHARARKHLFYGVAPDNERRRQRQSTWPPQPEMIRRTLPVGRPPVGIMLKTHGVENRRRFSEPEIGTDFQTVCHAIWPMLCLVGR